jgi:hypothetical protein
MKQLVSILFTLITLSAFGQATGIFPRVTASGTDTYTAPAPSGCTCASYVDGGRYQVLFTNANTVTGATLNINSIGARTIYNSAGQALSVGEIKASDEKILIYSIALSGFRTVGGGGGGFGWPLTGSATFTGSIDMTTTDSYGFRMRSTYNEDLPLLSHFDFNTGSNISLGLNNGTTNTRTLMNLHTWTASASNLSASKSISMSVSGIGAPGITVTDGVSSIGFRYAGNYSANWTDRDIPDWGNTKSYADAKVAATITNGVTTSAPNQDVVFDALATKIGGVMTGDVSITDPTNTRTFAIGDGFAEDPDAIIFNGTTSITMGVPGTYLTQTSSGNTFQGPVILASNPAVALGATPKQYVDAKVATTITDGVTTSAPSQNNVFDALALKADLTGVWKTSGTTAMTSAVVLTNTISITESSPIAFLQTNELTAIKDQTAIGVNDDVSGTNNAFMSWTKDNVASEYMSFVIGTSSNIPNAVFTDGRLTPKGFQYGASGYVTDPQSLADKEYVDARKLTATATLDFGSSGAATVSDRTVTVTGAALGDPCVVGAPHASVTATASFWCWVSSANTVTVRFSPKATEDPGSGSFKVSVLK